MPSGVMTRLKLPQRRLTLKRHSELRQGGCVDCPARRYHRRSGPGRIAQLHLESVSLLESSLTFVSVMSGKEAALLSPPPLGTARMTFAICRSSLSNALLGARFRHSQTKAVNLPVAYRM